MKTAMVYLRFLLILLWVACVVMQLGSIRAQQKTISNLNSTVFWQRVLIGALEQRQPCGADRKTSLERRPPR